MAALRRTGKIPPVADGAAAERGRAASMARASNDGQEAGVGQRRRLQRSNSLAPTRTPPSWVDPAYEELEREHEEATRVKNIQQIELGRFEIDCWYFSPYPDEFSSGIDRMYVCERCLKYMRGDAALYERHFATCTYTGPPGKLIYLKDQLAVFELDGEVQKLYCQNLCLLAKLFLDHKTLYYDVAPFLFYVLCEIDESGTHPVGYFSKEKASPDGYNLACILVLPPYQKRGYGRFLIQLSYELTRREGRMGSPEKPLSDLGRLSYLSFWSHELLVRLRAAPPRTIPSIEELAQATAFTVEDVRETLVSLGLLKHYRGQLMLSVAPKTLDAHLRQFEDKKFTLVHADFLNWP